MRGLFYCQSYGAAAPWIRSFNLCRSLVKDFDIDFLYGGQPIELSEQVPRFNLVQLPSFNLKRGDDLIFEYDYGNPEHLATFQQRWEKMQFIQNVHYDFFITELFPLAKQVIEEEVVKIIEVLKKNNPKCLILSSVRDVLDLYSFRFGKAIKKMIDQHYDAILAHSDPNVISIQETFPVATKLQNKIIHTGFIPNRIKEDEGAIERKKEVLVTIGAGGFGFELLEAVAAIVPAFHEYQFTFVFGPQCPLHFKKQFQQTHPDLTTADFIPNFESTLKRCALSISLGGYTLIDVICTRTPAIALPLVYPDQFWRTSRLDFLGLVKKIEKGDLEKEKLTQIIREVLNRPYPNYPINTDGAENSRKEILARLEDV